jgi:hypothetical protein
LKRPFAIIRLALSRTGVAIRTADALALGIVVGLLIAGCLALAASALSSAFNGNQLPLLFAVILWLPLAWGLWHRRPLARRVALALLWLVIVILPIGVINPFAAMDGLVSADTPVWRLAVPVFSIVAMALFMVHILGKYKAEFRHGERRG